MLADVLVWMLEGGCVAFVAWGGWLCLSDRERRSGQDRRSLPRGGRRPEDALPARAGAVRPAVSATVRGEASRGERAARMVA